ncbi:MAG: cell division protein FtsL [Pseudomonadota bacterium]
MSRLNLLLLAVVILCALSVITSQHQARKRFIELQQEKDRAQQMEVEWGQLQLEQRTWAIPSRVEKIAESQLNMQLPAQSQVRYVHARTPTGGRP